MRRRGAGQLIVDGAVRRANQFGTPGTEKQDTSETHNAAQAEYDRLAALVVPWPGAQIPGVLKTANGMPSLGDTKREGQSCLVRPSHFDGVHRAPIDLRPSIMLVRWSGKPYSSGGWGALARGIYVENDLSFRQRPPAFQHHVGLSRISEREDRADVRFQFTPINEFGNFAQALGSHIDQEEGCVDAVSLCAVLIGLGHRGDQFAAGAKNLKRTRLCFA